MVKLVNMSMLSDGGKSHHQTKIFIFSYSKNSISEKQKKKFSE